VEGQPGAEVVVRGDQRAADDVRVPAHVLGGRVHDHVGAERERLLQVGGGEGVVHDQQRPRVVRHLGERGDVADAEQRVGRRLHPDDPGLARLHGGAHGLDRGQVRRRPVDAPALVDLGEEPEGAAVRVVGDDDVVAGVAHRAQQAVLGGEPRGEGEPVPPPSMAARHSSSAVRVGFAEREYS
jgi:hypothetical protein